MPWSPTPAKVAVVVTALLLLFGAAFARAVNAAPSPSLEERNVRALEQMARSLKEMERCR